VNNRDWHSLSPSDVAIVVYHTLFRFDSHVNSLHPPRRIFGTRNQQDTRITLIIHAALLATLPAAL